MKKVIWIIAIALILLIGGSVTALAIANMPENVALRSLSGAIEDFTKREEFESLGELYGSSITASLSTATLRGDDLLEGSSFTGKLYVSKNALMLTDVDLVAGDKRLTGEFYISNNMIYIKEDNIFGGAYGARLSKLEHQLKNSIFFPNKNMSVALSEEEYNKILDALHDDDKLTKDTEKLSNKVAKDLRKILRNNAEFKSSNDGTGKRTVTLTLTPKKLSNLLRETVEYFQNSEDIRDFIKEYEEQLRERLSALNIVINGDLLDKYENAVEKFEKAANNIRISLGDGAESLSVIITTPKFQAKLIGLEVKSGNKSTLSLVCGDDGMKESESISLVMGENIFSYESKIGEDELDLLIHAKTADNTSVSFSVKASADDEIFSAELNTTTGSSPREQKSKLSLSGSMTKIGDKTTLSINELTSTDIYGRKQTLKLNLTIKIDENDKMPRPIRNFTTPDKVTYDEAFKWQNELKDFGK